MSQFIFNYQIFIFILLKSIIIPLITRHTFNLMSQIVKYGYKLDNLINLVIYSFINSHNDN